MRMTDIFEELKRMRIEDKFDDLKRNENARNPLLR
jgi:hypothetical protein